MKKIILAVAVAAVATMAVVSSASADVPRYQTQTLTFTATQPKDAYGQWTDVWTHNYTAVLNPCDGSFTGTGSASGTGFGFYTDETITGNFDGTMLGYMAKYLGPNATGLTYALNGNPANSSTTPLIATAWDAQGNVINTSPNVLEFKISNVHETQLSSFKNHGEYVSSQGGGSDAAHSCIGMPIH